MTDYMSLPAEDKHAIKLVLDAMPNSVITASIDKGAGPDDPTVLEVVLSGWLSAVDSDLPLVLQELPDLGWEPREVGQMGESGQPDASIVIHSVRKE